MGEHVAKISKLRRLIYLEILISRALCKFFLSIIVTITVIMKIITGFEKSNVIIFRIQLHDFSIYYHFRLIIAKLNNDWN